MKMIEKGNYYIRPIVFPQYLIVGGTEEADAGPTPPYAEIWNAGAEDGWTDRVPLPPVS